jgi:hypothetical protein
MILCNDIPIIRGALHQPRVGEWSADLLVDSDQIPTGFVTLSADGGTWSLKGTAFRLGVFVGTVSLRVVGGAAGLSPPPAGQGKILPAKQYRGVTLRNILRDLCAATGETLSADSATSPLGQLVQSWTRMPGSGKSALRVLLDQYGLDWRILSDGTLWVGTDSWPDAPAHEFNVLGRAFAEGRIQIGYDRPFLMPGTVLTLPLSAVGGNAATQRQNVEYLDTDILPGSLRSEVYFDHAA